MNIYHKATDFLANLPVAACWPQMQTIFDMTACQKPHDWSLPVIACEAVGETAENAIPAITAVGCSQISIILVDDMLDKDPRGEYHQLGEGVAANLALAFQAAAMQAVEQSKTAESTKLLALHSLNHMTLTTALGQQWDIQNVADEVEYWKLIETKSAPFFGTALYLGALLGGASPETADQLQKIGRLYGEMIQIHDDLNDVMATPANPDWLHGRSPLPILFAQHVPHPYQERFLYLRQHITTPDYLAEAQNILIRCGAVSYCIDELMNRHQHAQNQLQAIALSNSSKIEELLAVIINPVKGLFAAMAQEL